MGTPRRPAVPRRAPPASRAVPRAGFDPLQERAGRCRDTRPLSAVLDTLLDTVEPFLNAVIDQLAETATWRGRNRGAEPGSPPWLLRDAASLIATALATATHADVQILRAHYDPAPDLNAVTKQALGSQSGPPSPPSTTPPAPGPRR